MSGIIDCIDLVNKNNRYKIYKAFHMRQALIINVL